MSLQEFVAKDEWWGSGFALERWGFLAWKRHLDFQICVFADAGTEHWSRLMSLCWMEMAGRGDMMSRVYEVFLLVEVRSVVARPELRHISVHRPWLFGQMDNGENLTKLPRRACCKLCEVVQEHFPPKSK